MKELQRNLIKSEKIGFRKYKVTIEVMKGEKKVEKETFIIKPAKSEEDAIHKYIEQKHGLRSSLVDSYFGDGSELGEE